MTLSEIRTAVWEELGEPPNCDPLVAAGLARLNGWINRGYKKILFWKFGDGTQVRFPATEGEVYFKSKVVTGTIASSTTSTVVLDSGAGGNDDQYNGWVIDASSHVSLIVDYDGSSRTATLGATLDTAPTGAYSLYKRHMKFCAATDVGASENITLSSVSAIKEVQRIVLIEDQTELEPGQRTETFAGSLLSPGRPTSYIRRGAQIIFDCPAEEALWYHMEYARIPEDLTTDGQEPELPETFHEAVMMWALWRGYHWMQETDMAYSTKRDLIDFMATTKSPNEMASDREDARIELNF
jgi:hypothetical protein